MHSRRSARHPKTKTEANGWLTKVFFSLAEVNKSVDEVRKAVR